MTDHHRFLLQLHLQHIDALDAAITAIDREVNVQVEPFHTQVLLLTTIPGVSDLSAYVIRAEIGGDMSRFPTVGNLISWAGFCPRNDESAGKRRSNRMRKGAPWLKTTLIQCAWAAARKKASYLQAQFHRLRARRGAQKAIGAVAASILTAVYEMLKTGTLYDDLGSHHFDRCGKGKQIHRLVSPAKPWICRPNHSCPGSRLMSQPSSRGQRSTHRPPDGGQSRRGPAVFVSP